MKCNRCGHAVALNDAICGLCPSCARLALSICRITYDETKNKEPSDGADTEAQLKFYIEELDTLTDNLKLATKDVVQPYRLV